MASYYNAASAMALPHQQAKYQQQKVNQQVARAAQTGKRASPERLRAIAAARATPRVRVVPTREELRAVLVHPNGMAFRSEGSVEWPLDRFTHRRLRDGDIKIETQEKREQQDSRQRAAARPQQKSEGG